MYYADSLSRVYGSPGCGKSFMVLDQALTMATGGFWCGHKIERGRVIYVMAEGQSVNRDRAEAWMSKRGKTRDDLRGWFHVVPDAVQLTEVGVRQLVKATGDLQASMVILDTKNAMMVGEENSASDFARMRRALDSIRKASGCCVVLVDHTGYEGTRARGSSAATAAMDTEIRVTKNDDERPALISAEITRDKAGEAGAKWVWRLVPEYPAAVLERAEEPEQAILRPEVPDWSTVQVPLPRPVREFEGSGKYALQPLATVMQLNTSAGADPDRIGISRAEAYRQLKKVRDPGEHNVIRAWSALKDMGYVVPATESTAATGRHIWVEPDTGRVPTSGPLSTQAEQLSDSPDRGLNR